MRYGFRYKLLALALLPLLIGLGGIFIGVTRLVESEVRANAHEDLRVGANVVAQYLASRQTDLNAQVEILAADYAIKEVLAFGEDASLQSALANHGQRVGAAFAAFIGLDGIDPVSSDPIITTPIESALLELVSANEDASEISALLLNQGVYQIVGAPVRAPTTIGFLVLGIEANEAIVEPLERLTGLEVALLERIGHAQTRVHATTADTHRREAWFDPAVDRHQTFTSLTSAGEHISLNSEFLPGDERVVIAMRRSLDEAMLPYRQARNTIAVIGVTVLLLVAGLALWLASSMARPLRNLTDVAERMTEGEYRPIISVYSKDEIGTLANAFRSMQGGIAEREAKITHRAYHDSLTDLPNREQLVQTMREHLIQQIPSMVVICLRLTNMQKVASSTGQKAGDQLTVQAARQIEKLLPAAASLFHTGTDEFFALLANTGPERAETLIDEIVQSLFKGVVTQHHHALINAHAGLSVYPEHGEEPADLVRAARIAVSDAEDTNSRFTRYALEREGQFERQIKIINDLPAAIAGAEIQLVYQPKIAIGTGALYGAEVLVRWEHAEFGFLPPDEFIPAAEQAGTITPLTRYVVQRALQALSVWRTEHLDLTMGINLSTRDLLDREFPRFVQTQLADAGLPSDALTLEITETSIMENTDLALECLDQLRELGVRISIDDFGTGQSSLSQLHKLPVDELKIDKGFVMNLETDPASEILVESTIALAHRFGLSVVAEGVEDEYSLRRLADLNCEIAQGYFFSKPIPQSAFTMWARDFTPTIYTERRDRSSRPFDQTQARHRSANLTEVKVVRSDKGEGGVAG